MKKTSIGKFILNLIVAVAFLISLYVLFPKFFDPNRKDSIYQLTVTLISLLSGFIVYIYNNSNSVFFLLNKVSTFFSLKTVSWQMSYRITGLTFESLKKLQLELLRVLKIEKSEIMKDEEKEESRLIKLKSSKKIESFFDLRWNEYTNGKYSMTIIFSSQTSHRDVRKQWEFYRKVIEESIKVISQESNHSKKPYEEKSYYTVSLNTIKNPFYLLTIKTYDKPKNIKFDLSFNVDGVKFKTTNNKIVITTEDVTKVDTILKDYVLLGKVT